MNATLEWYLSMQQKYKFHKATALGRLNYSLVVVRAGGLYCFEGEEFVMVFDVTRCIRRNGRVIPEGLTHMGTLRGAQATGLLQEVNRDLAEAELVPGRSLDDSGISLREDFQRL